MKAPSEGDHIVTVTAYITDEVFGYDHWRATQYSSPNATVRRPAVLLIFDDETERKEFLTKVGIDLVGRIART